MSGKCQTRRLKNIKAFAKSAVLQVGTVHFVAINFGGAGVGAADVATAVKYLQLAAPKISAYCSSYGDAPIRVDPNPVPFSAPAANYNDSQLQNWVNAIVKAQGYGPDDALVFFNPPGGVENTDAPVSQGILGYHGSAPNPYSFVNAQGTGFTVDDQADVYAEALSHEIAEMVVDPAADNSKPEVCDSCSGNCGVDFRNYFDSDGNWLGGTPSSGYAFFTDGVATPATVSQCPAPQGGCTYAPPGAAPAPPPPVPTPTPPPTNCDAIMAQAISDLENGQIIKAFEALFAYIECLISRPTPQPAPPPSPPPTPPPSPGGIPPCEIPPDRVGNVLKAVYHPARLSVYEDCNYAKGVVAKSKQEQDGDVHIDLVPDPDSPVQAKGNQYVICEIIPYDQPGGSPQYGRSGLNLTAPPDGSHVVLYGPHVFDTIHGWDEIHPVWKILVL